MKKSLLTLMVAFTTALLAQQPAPLIWGVSPYSDDLYAADTTSWTFPINLQPTITGSAISGLNGMAYDPTTYKSYVIARVGSIRHLAEINLATGACTVVGNMGDNFASITFDETGQLWGATGDGASVPEALYRINKATATSTLAFLMGNGSFGEAICYNRFDNKMYHWSGDATIFFESWPITNTTYAPTNITTSGNLNGEIFGALNLSPNNFVVSNISSEFQYASAAGLYGLGLTFNPDNMRGLIMPPRFAISSSTICANASAFGIYSNCLQLFDSVYYYWGDGNVTQMLASASSTAAVGHVYASPGTYTINVQLFNGAVPKSTITTFTVLVDAPIVTIAGSSSLCAGGSVTLTGSNAASSQWYANGVAVPGASSNTLNVTSGGWYNLLQTNANGCSDTAAAGILVSSLPEPTISVSNGSLCAGLNYNISPSGANTYTITGGTFTVSPAVTTSYSITGTSSAGCISSTPAVVTIFVGQTPTLIVTSSQPTICVGATAVLTVTGGADYQWAGGPQTNTIAVSPSVTTSYIVAGTGSIACSTTVSFEQSVSDCSGLTENSVVAGINVIPNPGSGIFKIRNVPAHSQIEIVNAIGEIVLRAESVQAEIDVDISSLSSGVYVFRSLHHGRINYQAKVIKQ